MSPARRDRGPERQPFMPEGAGGPASVDPPHRPTRPEPWRLYEGHLTARCSIVHDGAPACPACLAEVLIPRTGE